MGVTFLSARNKNATGPIKSVESPNAMPMGQSKATDAKDISQMARY